MSSSPGTLAIEITDLLSNSLGLEIPSAETDLLEAGILDSMGCIEVLLQLENSFGIRLSLNDIEFDNFRSVKRIAEFVASRNVVKPYTDGA